MRLTSTSPRRICDFTVPSGSPVSSTISACEAFAVATGQNPLMRKYHLAYRYREFGDATISWSPATAPCPANSRGHPIVLFMKGTAQFPMCGFSGRAVQILNACGVDDLFDVDDGGLDFASAEDGSVFFNNIPGRPTMGDGDHCVSVG